jgi:prepilin-type N-terminal cleavage/methylation domain-containing protein
MKRHELPTAVSPSRSGFSLIELLVVIVIIGILMALILPAIGRVRTAAQVTQSAAELTQLDTAISKFQSDFGVEPFSELVVTENPAVTAWDSSPGLKLTRTRLRKIWPQLDFTGSVDFNADGAFTGDSGSDATITFLGSESLIFFLGGVMNRDANGNAIVDPAEVSSAPSWIGFSKNPVTPFITSGSNRIGPYFTFDVARMVDTDGDGMMEYLDTLPGQSTPIYFVSANNGQGYSSVMSVYVQADGRTPLNKDSHQLISPGLDASFGFDLTAGLRRPYSAEVDLKIGRGAESDNIANFKPGGTLEN